MKKKLLALAVAGAFVAPSAMADTANVNVYGVMDLSYDTVSTGSGYDATGAAVPNSSQNKISSNASRIGFKGAEDLGGGTAAVFQIENGITADGAAGAWAARNTFVGLKGDSWGEVLLGNNDTPYKSSTRKMDLFGDSIADNRSLMGGIAGKTAAIGFDGRSTDSITYNSPSMGGVKVGLQYRAGAEGATSGSIKGNAWSLAGTYAEGPITAALAYEVHDFGGAGTGTLAAAAPAVAEQKERAVKLAGGYAMDQFAVNVVYEKTSDGFGAGRDLLDHRTWYLAGKYNLSGSDALKLAYTNQGNVGGLVDTGAKQISLGYDHSMSKRTTVYALYTRLTNEKGAGYNLGIAAASTGGVAIPAGNVDHDPSSFAVGIKHAF
jgi:predicted porin